MFGDRRGHQAGEADEPLFRKQVTRILASPDFSGSRNLSDFLSYASECALHGRTYLEQVEIAEKVLGRSEFNPLEDATVRKLATHVRQRLEHYYAGPGAQDEVRIVLPVRSYIPRFERVERPALPSAPPRFRPWRLAAMTGFLGLLFGAGWLWLRPQPETTEGRTEIWTARGDIVGKANDPPPESIRLGPFLTEEDEVTVRLTFTAELEAQQAGLIIWQEADNFVRFGRKFVGRNMLEFDVEKDGALQATPASHTLETEGQEGTPLFLSIRRMGSQFAAFASHDGRAWRVVGPPLEFQGRNLRAGVYAFHGRRDATPALAVFDRFAAGPTFTHWSSTESLRQNGFHFTTNCASGEEAWSLNGQDLVIAPAVGGARCHAVLLRPVEGADWQFKARLDFQPTAEVGAGLFVRGKNARYRLVRNELNGAAISWIHEGVNAAGERDFSGSPVLYLRLVARKGLLRAGFSRDDVRYREFPPVSLDSLGPPLEIGPGAFINDIAPSRPFAAPRFTFFHQEFSHLRSGP